MLAATPLSPLARRSWRVAQALVLAVGVGLVAALILRPELGVTLVWNVLIPVAPALLVFAPGVWRNVCPLGSSSLLVRHAGGSARRKLSPGAQGAFALGGVVLLLLLVPLRHVLLNLDGLATAWVLLAAGAAAVGLGLAFEWKSAWCAGLCPVHPVEKLYGTHPAVTVPNAHCDTCQRCTAVCPDSTRAMTPLRAPETNLHAWAGTLLTGGFAGYVWGWFQVPDGAPMAVAFAWPFAGFGASLGLYLAARTLLPRAWHGRLARTFAAMAVACYYAFRLPALFGQGVHPGDGMLIDLRGVLPAWFAFACAVVATALFMWWLVLRQPVARAWTVRPAYAPGVVGQSDSPD